MTYFNEIDPDAARWLGELFPTATIDTRSIADVRADDLIPHRRAHFFAGIGGWEYALQLAGWPDDVPVWTGSCPCQPFSVAGKGKGTDDARHLWPELRRLVSECLPSIVFGEQVASKDGRLWLAGVRSDLEALGYAVGAADLCAAGIGAPHIRQRLYWGAVRISDAQRHGLRIGRWAWVTVGKHKLKVKHYPARGWGVAKGPTAGPWCATLAEAYAGWLSAYESRPVARKAALRAKVETATPRELRSMFTGLTERQKRLAIKRALMN